MTDSAVISLQALASDPTSDIVAVLMKAKMIAFKLDLTDITEWIELELSGYPTRASAPEYRTGQGRLKARNPFNGWIPVDFGNAERDIVVKFTTFMLLEPVSSLKRVMDRDLGTLRLPVPFEMVRMLNSNPNDGREVCWFFSAGIIDHVFTTIRKKILEWSLELEKKGILGEGLIFSSREKEEAQNVTINNTINNNNGLAVIGDVRNDKGVVGGTVSNVQQQNITGDFSALERQLRQHGLNDTDIKELKEVIDQTPMPETKEDVEKGFGAWIGKITGKAISKTVDIAVAAAPTLLTNYLCDHYGIPV